MPHFESTIPNPPSSFVEVWYGDSRIGPPAPLIEFGQEITRNPAGERIIVLNTITLSSTHLNTPSGVYNDMYSAQETLRSIFSTDNNEFSIRAGAANTEIAPGEYIASGIYPRVRSITLPEDLQVTDFDYTVVLEYEDRSGVNSGLIESITDNWAWSENSAEQTVDITHNVNIKGRNTAVSGAASNAHTNALQLAGARLGLNNAPVGFPAHVHQSQSLLYEISTTRTESVGLEEGTYSATETFKVGSGIYPWNHFRTINCDVDANDFTTVTLQGTIQGFGRTNIGSSGNIGLDNAVSGWLNHVKPVLYADAAQFYSNLNGANTLNTKIISLTQAKSEFAGTLTYSTQFSDAPADNVPSGIAERSSNINRQDPIEIIARHPIPFRSLGTILQNMGTPTDGRITISATARAKNTGDVEADVNRAIAQVESDLNAIRPDPNSAEFLTLEIEGNPTLSYDILTLSANASVNYVFTLDIGSVNSPSGNLSFSRYGGGIS